MRIEIHHHCTEAESYRAARVKSLFNVDSGSEFRFSAELPLDEQPWGIGLVVGPSGSGKTSIGRKIFKEGTLWSPCWPKDSPIIDVIGKGLPFDAIPAALSAVGLGSVPCWLRPFHVLSQGEQFRANLARLVCAAPETVVVDEFTSVVDRQVAKVGAMAFGKAWRRTAGQCVLLSCHYDIVEWLQPDWVFDTATGKFTWGCLRCRPKIELSIEQTDHTVWPLFEPHHYLRLSPVIAGSYYVGLVDGAPVAHVAFTTRAGMIEARACRLVVMPEWQGVGIGSRFLGAICEAWLHGRNRYGLSLRTIFNTSHPGLTRTLRHDPKWTQISAHLIGESGTRSYQALIDSRKRGGGTWAAGGRFGGHFRAIQGFRYLGADLQYN